jgi:hypothetical protein
MADRWKLSTIGKRPARCLSTPPELYITASIDPVTGTS